MIFIQQGRIALASSVEDLAGRFVQLTAAPEQARRARQLKPFYEREVFGRVVLFFEGHTSDELKEFGDLRTPTIADLFVAKMQGVAA